MYIPWDITFGQCPPFCFAFFCGSYTKDRIGALAKPCPSAATTLHFIRAKSRLLEGRHPVSNSWLSKPYPVCKVLFTKLPELNEELSELEIVDLPDSEEHHEPVGAQLPTSQLVSPERVACVLEAT